MAFTCPKQSSLSDTELNQLYGQGNALLPNPPNGASDRDGSGMLSANAISRQLATLKSAGSIPNAKAINADSMVAAQNAFLAAVKAEYCFYDSRYKYALEKMFGAVRAAYINNSAEAQAVIQKYLTFTQQFNQCLNDLTQIMNAITDDSLKGANNISDEIKAFNDKIQALKIKLNEQNAIITSSDATTRISKQMVKFTEEKARRSDNLLKLYGFLNVVVVGLLVYVYRAAGDD